MSGIPDEVIEQVRDAADMVAIIGEQVELRRTGADYRGPCPFHGGQKKNFAVIPKKQMFYCFVCHEAGDIFSYFMKREGLEYPAAVRLVASSVGMEIPDRPSGGPDPNERLYDALSLAGDWYARELREGDGTVAARDYLANRGFDISENPELGFGFAPKGDRFMKGMNGLGISDEVMLEAGLLVARDDGSLRPRFWNRLLIPIHDVRGRVVGFGGRLLGEGEPKYLNSSDNKIFHKGQLLYNLHHAKQSIRRKEMTIVVEGYFDVLKLAQVGVDNVVASLGTAFTAGQAALLKRYTKEVTILYDSDQAGLKATFRAADVMLEAGLRVMVATMPEGQDPDTLAAEGGKEAIEKVVRDALDVCERKIQLMERAGMLATVPGRRKTLDKLLPTLRATKEKVTRDLYVSLAANALGTSREAILGEVDRRARATNMPHVSRNDKGGSVSTVTAGFSEGTLITILIHEPAWRERIGEMMTGKVIPAAERELIDALVMLPANIQPGDLLRDLGNDSRILLRRMMSNRKPEPGTVDALVEGSLDRIDARAKEEAIQDLDRKIFLAQGEEKDTMLRDKKALVTKDMKNQSGKWKLN